jgi:hypothetical protein
MLWRWAEPIECAVEWTGTHLRFLDEVTLNLRRIGWRNIYGGMYVKRRGWR